MPLPRFIKMFEQSTCGTGTNRLKLGTSRLNLGTNRLNTKLTTTQLNWRRTLLAFASLLKQISKYDYLIVFFEVEVSLVLSETSDKDPQLYCLFTFYKFRSYE